MRTRGGMLARLEQEKRRLRQEEVARWGFLPEKAIH